jgi:hypothetical protein
MENKDCQIDHEQTSPNNESLLRKCSICQTIKSHSNFVKSKNQKYGIVMTVKKEEMINFLVIYVLWMFRYDIKKDISKKYGMKN